jgi:hypothetical protein
MFKKFATAVATASLLAGLFGSAFAPSVLARGASQAPRLSNSDLEVWNDVEYQDGGIKVLTGANMGDDGIGATEMVISSFSDHSDDHSDNHYNDANNSIGFFLYDAFGDPVEVADLSAVSTGFVEVAWAYTKFGSDSAVQATCHAGEIQDAYSLKDELTGDNAIDSTEYDLGDYGDGGYALCIRAANPNKPGTGTITVTVNGVKFPAITVHVVGEIDTLTFEARGNTTVAAGNAELYQFANLIAKDRAGFELNGMNGFWQDIYDANYTYNGKDGNYIHEADFTEAGEADSEEVLNASGNVIDFTDGHTSSRKAVDLLENTCTTADAGKTYNLAVEIETASGDLVTSNAIPVTCAGASSKTKITGLSVEYATGDADWVNSAAGIADAKTGDGVIGVYATVVDANGKPAGLDDTIGWSTIVNSYTESVNSTLDLTAENGAMGVGGKMLVAYLVPDVDLVAKYGYSITIVDADKGTANGTTSGQALKKEFTYTVGSVDLTYSLSRVRNAAKTQATWTADYGLSCSNRLIDFYWENADGSKAFTVSRKANIDGVAKFVMNRRNTVIFVMAMGCDGFLADSDFVKARFK